jgi:hypothetical protein
MHRVRSIRPTRPVHRELKTRIDAERMRFEYIDGFMVRVVCTPLLQYVSPMR